MNTPESQQIIEIPHPLLARYPRLFQCRRYEVQFYRAEQSKKITFNKSHETYFRK
jgi:hypothetical protein